VESRARQEDFERKAARRQFGMALNANTAFANLLERKGSLQDVIQLTNDNFTVVNCGATSFSKWDADWLFFGGKGESFSIEDLTSSEDLFVRTEVSEEESLKVGSIPLHPMIGRTVRQVMTTTTVGLYEIGSGMHEWAAKLTARLVERRKQIGRSLTPDDALPEYQLDPEWVNDDSLLIARCRVLTGGRAARSTSVVLVSGDRRLGNQMSNSCNVVVIRIDPTEYILYMAGLGENPLNEEKPQTLWEAAGRPTGNIVPTLTLVDTGCVNAFLARTHSRDLNEVKIYDPIRSHGGIHLDEPRSYTYRVTTVPSRKRVRCHVIWPVLKPKRFQVTDPLPTETGKRKQSLVSRSASSKDWRSRT